VPSFLQAFAHILVRKIPVDKHFFYMVYFVYLDDGIGRAHGLKASAVPPKGQNSQATGPFPDRPLESVKRNHR
jgi:hypothetical protein